MGEKPPAYRETLTEEQTEWVLHFCKKIMHFQNTRFKNSGVALQYQLYEGVDLVADEEVFPHKVLTFLVTEGIIKRSENEHSRPYYHLTDDGCSHWRGFNAWFCNMLFAHKDL